MPGHDAFNDLVNAIDPVSLAKALNAWPSAMAICCPKASPSTAKISAARASKEPSFDAPFRSHPFGAHRFAPVHLAPLDSLCHHATGAPLAMATCSGQKDDCEMPVAPGLLEEAAAVLPNAVVTGDALYCQKNGNHCHQRRGRCFLRAQGQPAHVLPDIQGQSRPAAQCDLGADRAWPPCLTQSGLPPLRRPPRRSPPPLHPIPSAKPLTSQSPCR